jgi:hypothetical protein
MGEGVAELRPVDGGMLLVLDRDEIAMLTSLVTSLAERLALDGRSETDEERLHDPIVARFTPETSRSDPEADRELRAMLAGELLDDRRARLLQLATDLAAWADGDGVRHVLDAETAGRLVDTLNDLRLAIGASIGIESLDRADIAVDDPRALSLDLMDHLGWMQGRLIEFIDP